MLGILEDKSNKIMLAFQEAGDLIYMIGDAHNNIASSEYQRHYHNAKLSPAPYFDMDAELNCWMP
jgi:phosphoribosylformylglycinamidine synthase subunit PurL